VNLRHRPPLVLRLAVALTGFGIVLANAALLLSDRAPGALRVLFGSSVRRITARLDADGSTESGLDARGIGSDSIVHFGLWAVAALVVGLAVWSWIGLACSSATVAGASLVLEVAQGRYSSTRAVEVSDAAFNLLGVAAGSIAAGAIYMAIEGCGRLLAHP